MRPESIHILSDKRQTSIAAAMHGAQQLRDTLATKQEACIVLATGVSQFDLLNALLQEKDIDWHRVIGFHLDEYAGLPITHPASFSKYLWERFVSKLPTPMNAFHFIQTTGGIESEISRLNRLIGHYEIDVAFIGIGENGHLAFNDPPADFNVAAPYIYVELDAACRQQQLGEGWFDSIDDVPTHAISMSIQHIMKCKQIICTVPGRRKAEAVQHALTGPVTPTVPASILQTHPRCDLYLDKDSASRLDSGL
ncbi:MAG: glucosamine-6-phosphate deaminase [Rhodothermaceae bacterium]|nr:glucosamine-6-phosphate deaminase [Rhodothermaceae bacterium]